MTDLEENEIRKAKLREAYIKAGADWIICDFEGIKKFIDKIDLFMINKN
jgi:hypothetical protein